MTSLPELRYSTPAAWTATVMDNFDDFLLDHAAAEKKASGMALSMIAHYPDRERIVESMAELAVEELTHYREVIRIIQQRKLQLTADTKDGYVLAMRDLIRQGPEPYFLDRLLTSGVIEARGCERFGLVAEALPGGSLKTFYQAITRSEARHYALFIELAELYFDNREVEERLHQVLRQEAEIAAALDIRSQLH